MSNQIELRHLRYFSVLSQELHYRKAAEKLFISQPGLSRQIKQMEENLGVQLLERSKKKVQLTLAGKYYQQEVNFILQHLKQINQQVRLLNKGVEGEINIGFVGSAMQNIIPSLLFQMNQDYPNISFSLEELSNERQIQRLLNHNLDIGFIRFNRVPEPLQMQQVFQDSFSLVLPNNHPINKDNFENMGQLSNENFILFHSTYSRAYYDRVISICEDQGFSPKVAHNTVHASTIYRLVENGLGVSIVPTALKFGYNLNIKFIELTDIPQQAILYIAWSKQNRNASLQKLLESIKN